jgi:hypothetical protein
MAKVNISRRDIYFSGFPLSSRKFLNQAFQPMGRWRHGGGITVVVFTCFVATRFFLEHRFASAIDERNSRRGFGLLDLEDSQANKGQSAVDWRLLYSYRRPMSQVCDDISVLGPSFDVPAFESSLLRGSIQLPQLPPQLEPLRGKSVFIALMLHNNESVVTTLLFELIKLLGFLRTEQGFKNMFVSVYESGSTDSTALALAFFEEHLRDLGVPHRVITHGALTFNNTPLISSLHLLLPSIARARFFLNCGFLLFSNGMIFGRAERPIPRTYTTSFGCAWIEFFY